MYSMKGGHTQEAITVACIMHCLTITGHAGKCYKALIYSGAAILLLYSTYQHNEDSSKTLIQPTTAKLNTTDGSPMTALGMTALHLRIADFKFTHSFVICNRLPDRYSNYFWYGYSEEVSISYDWGKEKNCYIQRDGNFLTYTKNC